MKNNKVVIILSIIIAIGAIIGGIFLMRKRKLEKPLAGTDGSVNDYRNFLMDEYKRHVRGKNKEQLEKWTRDVIATTGGTGSGSTLTPDNIIKKYKDVGAPDWVAPWVKLEAEKLEPKGLKAIGNNGGTYAERVEQAIPRIVEWQENQTNWEKLVEDSQKHGYWYREMSLKYPRIVDRLEFLENVYVTGINVN